MSAPAPSPSRESTDPALSADPEAAAKADRWLEDVRVPPNAVPLTASDPVPEFLSWYEWPCSHMEERTVSWSIDGMNVAEALNWLAENPTADLLTTSSPSYDPQESYDGGSVGNVPEYDALEGIDFTVVATPEGVALRADIGVFTTATECPELPEGQSWGGPGQG